MTTWSMDTVHKVVRLGVAVHVDRAVVAAARVDVLEGVRQKAAREIVAAARTFGVEVHPDDVSATEVPGRDDAFVMLLNVQWHPGWRDPAIEVELRGGHRDGEALTIRHDQLQPGIQVLPPMPSPFQADDVEPRSELPMPEHYQLAGWRETERRWVMATS